MPTTVFLTLLYKKELTLSKDSVVPYRYVPPTITRYFQSYAAALRRACVNRQLM